MSAFSMRRPLGRTGLLVSPLGIGGGGGIESEELLYAFDCGINYFFFSSDLHHFLYQKSASALRKLCERGSSVRDQVVLSTVTYVNDPQKLRSILVDQLLELHIDYIDVFHWGWITDTSDMVSLIKGAYPLKRDSMLTRELKFLSERDEQAAEINKELVQSGIVRYIGASFHSPAMARTWMRNLDVLMLRYNIAHRSVEKEVVPHLYKVRERDPGMVVFNTTRVHMAPPSIRNAFIPSIPQCYRFSLTQPWVDTVLAGLKTRQEIDDALAELEYGPMNEEECQQMREYGDRARALTHQFA